MPLLKTFIVEAETLKGQYICVTGNCPTLGNWEVNEAFVLSKTNESSIKHKLVRFLLIYIYKVVTFFTLIELFSN